MQFGNEYWEGLITSKQNISLRFRDVEGDIITATGHVVSYDSVSGREMVEMDKGLLIGTDQLIDIEGPQLKSNS